MKIVEETTKNMPFELEYETRIKNKTFLAELTPKGEINKDDINYFHITTAREAINCWLGNQDDWFSAVSELYKKFIKSVYFIWYVIPDNRDPNTMFTKVNMGKIQLTNAELIKALLLSKDNFNKTTLSENIDKRQTEISVAWDKTEQGLRDESFWYFLNEKEHSGTRIDMLFTLLAKEYNTKLPEPISVNQNYFPFLVFSAVLKSESDKEKFVKTLWDGVEKLYAEFRAWYADLNKYHIIGVEIDEIYSLTRGKRKRKILRALLEKAKEKTGAYDFLKITYDNANDRSKVIPKLLLLFNIATLVCKSEKQYRFPFDIYKGETGDKLKWSIEHIHARADESAEVDHSIGNLALLDAQTNSIYKDAPFHEKRRIIIERESKGLFVPLCTKNVFLKVYSKRTNNLNMDKWEDKDKADYVNTMEQTLKSFFEGEFINNGNT